jgi:hypothetical protein
VTPALLAAFGRLDAWLLEVCSREEARAARLAPGGSAGWAGVKALARPSVASLAFDDERATPRDPDLLSADATGASDPLLLARRAFALDVVETEALLVLLAPHLEPRYRALYGVLQDNLNQPAVTERLLLVVLGRRPERRRALYAALGEGGALVGSGLIRQLAAGAGPLERTFDLAPEVREALLGLPLPTWIAGLPVTWMPAPGPGSTPTSPPLDALQVIHGRGEWRELAERLGGPRPLGSIAPEDDKISALSNALALTRGAALRGALPVVDLRGLDREAERAVAQDLSRRLATLRAPLVIVVQQPVPLAAPHHALTPPRFGVRRTAWIAEAARRELALSPASAQRLAAATRLGVAGIARAFDGAGPLDPTTLESSLADSAARLGEVPVRHAQRIEARRSFADLVLRENTRAALARLLYFVQNRDRLAEERDIERPFSLGRGPVVLFSGLSGTGKTLAAEVIAHELGRPLYLVDLSQLVSKYIGDTEKHIDQVLAEGERAGAVLFFDEADAMFGSRTEQTQNANDRFANLGVGFLLQRIERHDGLVILATNLRHAIDAAFLRRFQFRVEFPFPEAAERRQIWERLLPATLPRADLDLGPVAEKHRLSGGEIRNAALKAIFLADEQGAPLSSALVEHAIALELLELGRLARLPGRKSRDVDLGLILRRFVEAIERVLADRLRTRFAKEVHVVHGAPTKEALAGRRPAVSVALYRLAAPRTGGVRLGLILSAWSHRAEEEHELLGVVQETMTGAVLKPLRGRKLSVRVQESHDFDLLQRFWSSHGHPVRASVVVEGEVA